VDLFKLPRKIKGLREYLLDRIHGVPKEPNTDKDFDKFVDNYKPSTLVLAKPSWRVNNTDPNVQSLDGDWEYSLSKKCPDENDTSWKDTVVPSQWAMQSPELFSYGKNVWYMKRFEISPEMIQPGKKHNILEFKGVDYKSEIFLNGKKLGEHEGYFAPFKFDITDKLRTDEPNILQVNVVSGEPSDKPLPISPRMKIKGINNSHDSRPGSLSASSNVANSGGIWNQVLIRTTGPETIDNSYVTTELSDDFKEAKLKFNYSLSNLEEEERDVTLQIKYRPRGETDPEKARILTQQIHLKPGSNNVQLESTEINPLLWETYERGKPNLYEMETQIIDNGEVSQEEKSQFGIRKLEKDPDTGALLLNGKSIFQRGINYIPSLWLSSYSMDDYKADLKMMKDANLNSVRVHASVLPQEFYSLCDEEGMLVYAEFPLTWASGYDSKFTEEAKSQYTEFIQHYRKHPSIFIWNAHNESMIYNSLLDRKLMRLSENLDPDRLHNKNASIFEHFYPGWYAQYTEKYVNVHKLHKYLKPLYNEITELGAQSIPKSAKEFIPQDCQWPMEKQVWKYHSYQQDNTEQQLGKAKNYQSLDDFIEMSQKYQYDMDRYIIEFARRKKYDHISGVYPYMFKETWPSINWGIVDYKRTPKMAYQGVKEAMAPVMVTIEWEKTHFRASDEIKAPLWLVNDKNEPMEDVKLNWKVFKFDDEEKKPLVSNSLTCDIPADSSKIGSCAEFTIPQNAQKGEKWVLDVELKDKDGKVLSTNDYVFGVKPKKKSDKYEPVHVKYPEAG
jgi:beta-mannosidase